MEWEFVKEMNHTYLVWDEDEETIKSDFRFRMIKENHVEGIVDMDIRNINGNYKVYYDVTDMESLEDMTKVHSLGYEDIEEIMKSLVLISSELEKLFCEEETLLLWPEFVFKNRVKNSYMFICHPHKEKYEKQQLNLFQFLLDNIEALDPQIMEGFLEVYDMVLSGVKSFKSLYEKFSSFNHSKEEENCEMPVLPIEDGYKKEERESMLKKLSDKYYIPSLRESLAGLCILSGVISVFIYIYLSWI